MRQHFRPQLRKKGKQEFCIGGALNYRHIMLLTATPFELDPSEMLNLFRIARASDQDIQNLSTSLKRFQQLLGRFYDLRMLPPSNERRKNLVKELRLLRTGLDLEDKASQVEGLETIMRRYIVRNLRETKPKENKQYRASDSSIADKITERRDYSLVNKDDNGLAKYPFKKFDDLTALCSNLPLIPFVGPDALYYLKLRERIQEIIEKPKEADDRGVFVAMDLTQGLSSYQQVMKSKILDDGELSVEIKKLLTMWIKNGRLHPKVAALLEIVRSILEVEIKRVENDPKEWFGKIVIFNKLVEGTAPHLREQTTESIEQLLREMLIRSIQNAKTFVDIQDVREKSRNIVREETDIACKWFTRRSKEKCEIWESSQKVYKKKCDDPRLEVSILIAAGFDAKESKHAVEVLRPYFEKRATQDLFLIDFFRNCRKLGLSADQRMLREFIRSNIISPLLIQELFEVIDNYLDADPDEDEAKRLGKIGLYESGIQKLRLIRERLRTTETVARYDGTLIEDRESNRINFNNRWNPLVLIVSRVGEEGIDLQTYTKYILHYDLEWNPAKMEQREGRVDREGYGHEGEPIDVRFFLLKDTYEERIFHTVMQRDLWFQILMGSQIKKLGQISKDDDIPDQSDDGNLLNTIEKESRESKGFLTLEEKEAVMLDLRPHSADG